MEDDDDCVDLLQEKQNSKNIDEFYANDQILDLRQALMGGLNLPQHKMGGPQPQSNLNTEAGEIESNEEQARMLQQIRSKLNNNF